MRGFSHHRHRGAVVAVVLAWLLLVDPQPRTASLRPPIGDTRLGATSARVKGPAAAARSFGGAMAQEVTNETATNTSTASTTSVTATTTLTGTTTTTGIVTTASALPQNTTSTPLATVTTTATTTTTATSTDSSIPTVTMASTSTSSNVATPTGTATTTLTATATTPGPPRNSTTQSPAYTVPSGSFVKFTAPLAAANVTSGTFSLPVFVSRLSGQLGVAPSDIDAAIVESAEGQFKVEFVIVSGQSFFRTRSMLPAPLATGEAGAPVVPFPADVMAALGVASFSAAIDSGVTKPPSLLGKLQNRAGNLYIYAVAGLFGIGVIGVACYFIHGHFKKKAEVSRRARELEEVNRGYAAMFGRDGEQMLTIPTASESRVRTSSQPAAYDGAGHVDSML